MAEIVKKQKVNVKGKVVAPRGQESTFAHRECTKELSPEAIVQVDIAKNANGFSRPS
jgi:hypothetical protein